MKPKYFTLLCKKTFSYKTVWKQLLADLIWFHGYVKPNWVPLLGLQEMLLRKEGKCTYDFKLCKQNKNFGLCSLGLTGLK